MKGFIGLIIFIIVIVAIFYGIWKLGIRTATKQAGKANEAKLLKMYNECTYSKRLTLGIVFGLFFGPFGGIYMYYLMKKRHAIIQTELESRKITFELKP